MEKSHAKSTGTLIRIAIVGPECTGKSTLSQQLSKHYRTVFVPEMAREYLEKLDRKYVLEDLSEISRLQLLAEEKMAGEAKQILICDTNLLVTKVWAEYVFGVLPAFIAENLSIATYDLHLLTQIDLPWEPDPLREHPHKRKELFEIYRQQLIHLNAPYYLVQGTGADRLDNAILAVDKILKQHKS